MNASKTIATAALLTLFVPAVACDSEDMDSAVDAELDAAIDGPELTATLADLDALPVDELDAEELALNAPPQPVSTLSQQVYQCDIDVLNGTTNCDPQYVDANEFDPSEWTANVDMRHKGANFRRMDIYAEICDPSEYAFAVADSPTTNGWGGDSSTADHDAEAHLYGTGLQVYGTLDATHGAYGNHTSLGSAHAGGCQVVHTVVYHKEGGDVGVFSFDGGGSPMTIRDTQTFKLDYQACATSSDPARGISCDFEDSSLSDVDRWHFGLNRTVGSGSRDGTGVQQACVVLSEDASVTPPDCLASQSVEGIPEGTRKFCIGAGTPAQMEAQCEQFAANWVGWYNSGTYNYSSHWGNPCPQGTSPVPNSYFYVPNSCVPYPGLGDGCGGPGSMNYEHQIGVMCQ